MLVQRPTSILISTYEYSSIINYCSHWYIKFIIIYYQLSYKGTEISVCMTSTHLTSEKVVVVVDYIFE